MAVLVWDEVGERIFQVGVSRGVLYLNDGTVAVWNGLTSVEDSSKSEVKSFYQDGVKFLDNVAPGDFEGKLKAYTYPDEFDAVSGVIDVAAGLAFHDQPASSFSLSYQTLIGNELEGVAYGYKIHILYNLIAVPEDREFGSTDDSSVSPIEFGWTLVGTPDRISKFRPTVHVSVNSITTPEKLLARLERKLYGTRSVTATLPSIQELTRMLNGDDI